MSVLFRWLQVSLLTTTVSTQSIGESVCFVGFVMDKYCLGRNSLLDNPQIQPLINPEQHTVHCLVDPGMCWRSGFEILADPTPGKTNYCRAFELDSRGNALVLALARSTSTGCSSCTGPPSAQTAGFRVTVRGTITKSTSPPTLAVSYVQLGSVGCPEGATKPTDLLCTAGEMVPYYIAHGALMLLGWGLILPAGVLSARFLKYKGPIWFHAHRALQIGGLLVASAGWIIALVKFDVFTADGLDPTVIHGSLGIVTMCLGLLQPVNAFFRPHVTNGPKLFARLVWEILHKASGYTALLLAMVTICLGIPLIGPSTAFKWAYGAIFGILGLLGLFIIRDASKSKHMTNERPVTTKNSELVGLPPPSMQTAN